MRKIRSSVVIRALRRFLRQAQDRLFDCAARGAGYFAQDDTSYPPKKALGPGVGRG
jgi:hypothetical protein